MTINRPISEEGARAAMRAAEAAGDYFAAALHALTYADHVGVRSPLGQQALATQAQVYATLAMLTQPRTVQITGEN
jgi:hypothetical protein